jgi:preprotein translocase subunit SecB
MTENPTTPGDGADQQPPVQARVAAQYIKDLSFENPNVERLLGGGPGDDPNLNVEVNVSSRQMAPNLYETTINFTAKAANKAGIIYDLEVAYAGLFQIDNMPGEALEPFLLINCPTLLFPFLRRLLADVTREGGFPPLLLDPIDFAQLYVQRRQQSGANDNGKAN